MRDGAAGGDFPDRGSFCEPEIAIGAGSDAVIVSNIG